jgi:hypothetical protein
MKNLFLLLLMISIGSVSFAQSVHFKLDAGFHGGLTFGDVKMYGIGGSVEPKVFINPKISAGARIEGTALFGGNIDDSGQDVSASVSARAAYIAKGEYYIRDQGTRPFFGFGLGYYTVASNSASTSGASISAGRHFGLSPQVGITFNNFRLSGIYHALMGKDLVTMSAGDTQEISRNYLVIELGFKIFGRNK